ncbi:MAG: hypothetical protein V3574_04380 [Candidatus Moraniibacteriota bacterium]
MQKEKTMQTTIIPDFLIIPGAVVFCPDLQPLDCKVYGVIYWIHSLKEGRCFASNTYLARICFPLEKNKEKIKNKSKSIQNSLLRLEKCGFIRRNYRDKDKKQRGEIIPLVLYRVPSNDGTVPSNDGRGVPSNDDHISNNIISKSIDIVADATSPLNCFKEGCKNKAMKDKRFCKEHQQMNLKQFMEWCKQGQAHVKIIGEWAETINMNLRTVAQWEEFISRNLRTAKKLIPFDRDQLEAGFERIEDGIKKGWLTEYTLETLYKFVTNPK